MLVGKTFWKGLVLPNLLFGLDITPYRKDELSKLQVYENKAFRNILGVPRYTAVEFLRGEIGASSMLARDAKNKILFLKHALKEGNNPMLADIVRADMQNKITKWSINTAKYLNELNITIEQVQIIHKGAIEKRTNDWDNNKWKSNVSMRKTLKLYGKFKKHPEEVKWFRNGQKYFNMMKARSDTLKLGWREFANESNKICKVCSEGEIETLQHFILDCPGLQNCRNRFIFLQLPRNRNSENLLQRILLYEKDDTIDNKQMIDILNQLWQERNKILER